MATGVDGRKTDTVFRAATSVQSQKLQLITLLVHDEKHLRRQGNCGFFFPLCLIASKRGQLLQLVQGCPADHLLK
jgi:hypothetical protein